MFVVQRPGQRASGASALRGKKPVTIELDIVGIPAIGAHSERTWGETDSTQWLGPQLRADFPKARILLWDHLTEADRAVEPGPGDHNRPTDAYQDAGRRFSRMRLQDWVDRFLRALEVERRKMRSDRPIVFICHSTGGLVLKEALCRRTGLPLVTACLGITFFATPHHGSNVLSLAACADTIKERLNLKWPLGNGLRAQLAPQSAYLELLNQRFAARVAGIEIWSYCEEGVLPLEVRTELLPHKFRSGKRLRLSDPVVDKRSAWITKNDNSILIDEEIMLSANADHVTLPRLEGDIDLHIEYLGELKKMIAEQDPKDRAERQTLLNTIFEQVRVGIYEFYNEVGRAMGPVNAIPPRQIRLNDILDPNIELGLGSIGLVGIDGPDLLVTGNNVDATTGRPHSANSAIVENWKAMINAQRGRGERLQVTDASTQLRRLSQSRAVSASRRSVVGEDAPTRSYGAAAPDVSGQLLDSILVTGSNTPPRREAPFAWVHTPYCVSSWVPQILSIVSNQKGIPNLHQRLISREHWLIHHNRARHAASHAQYVRPHFESLSIDESNSMVIPGLPSPPSEDQIPDKIQFALFFPFIHWDTFKMQQQRSRLINIRDTQENPHHVESDAIEQDNLEHHVLWQYLLSESPVHPRRSLDQYGYPALRNTEVRDADQILYKKTRSHNLEQDQTGRLLRTPRQRLAARLQFATSNMRKSAHGEHHRERPPTVLAVDTLWLWILRQDTLVTFASKREFGDEDPKMAKQADLISSAHKAARQDKLKDCYDLAALIVNKCVTTLLDEANDPHLHVFHIFEEYLSDLTEDYTNSFKSFRNMQRMDSDAVGAAEDAGNIDPMDTYASRKDLYHLFELRDITDELTTLRKLFCEQQKQIGVMRDEFRQRLPPLGKGTRAIELLSEALEGLDAYVESVDTMLKSSDAMQNSYEKLLDMKTAKVNVDEAHAARKQTEVSTEQAKAVTIFTIVTIIFSPLSFMSSLFGMNVSEWSGVDSNPELIFVIKVLGSVSLGVITLSLLIAFNQLTRTFVQWAWSWLQWMFIGSLNLIGLGWAVDAVSRRMHRSVTRLPRSSTFTWRAARSASGREKAAAAAESAQLSKASTLAAPTSTSGLTNGVSKGFSTADLGPSVGQTRVPFWRRRALNRTASDLDMDDVDVELAKEEPLSPTTRPKLPPSSDKRRPAFEDRSQGRAAVVFSQVPFGRPKRTKTADT